MIVAEGVVIDFQEIPNFPGTCIPSYFSGESVSFQRHTSPPDSGTDKYTTAEI
jgi:hypothetical protein